MSYRICNQTYQKVDSQCRHLFREPSGKLHLIYVCNAVIWHSYSTDGGKTWHCDASVEAGTGTSLPGAAIDSNGDLHVVFSSYQPDTYSRYYTKYHAGAFSSPIRVDHYNSEGYIDIAIDSSGVIHIIYEDFDGPAGNRYRVVKHRYNDGSGWSSPVTIISTTQGGNGGSVYYTLETGLNGSLHLSIAFAPTNTVLRRIIYSKYTPGSGWSNYEYISDGARTAGESNIVEDLDGNLYLSWVEIESNIYYIYFVYKPSGGSWSAPVYIGSGKRAPSLSITLDGNVYLFYVNLDPYNYLHKLDITGGTVNSDESLVGTGVYTLCTTLYSLYPTDYSNIPRSGYLLIYQDEDTALYFYAPEAKFDKFSSIAVCNFNGQFILGGFEFVGEAGSKYSQFKLNTVAWSQIGRFNLDYGSDVSKTAGFMHMPWGEQFGGKVLKLMKLGNHVIVYGDGGIALLKPISEPVSGFGLITTPYAGISSGFKCDGDEHVQLYIDTNNYVWTVDENLKFVKWGYKEFIEQLSGTIKVSYEPSTHRWFISDGSKCFVFNMIGMGSCYQMVTSAGNFRGRGPCGLFGESSDTEYRVVTDVLDYNSRGLKTITTMEAAIDVPSGVSVKFAVDYRYDKSDNLVRSSWNPTNPRGGTGIMKTALEFRLGVMADAYEYVNLDYILTTVQLSDRRMRRGVYTAPGGNDATSDNA